LGLILILFSWKTLGFCPYFLSGHERPTLIRTFSVLNKSFSIYLLIVNKERGAAAGWVKQQFVAVDWVKIEVVDQLIADRYQKLVTSRLRFY